MREQTLMDMAIRFFSSEQGFVRLLQSMMSKYRSLGRWGGAVTLTSLKPEEREALSTFFRQDFSRQKSVTLSLERFAQALAETRFGDIPALQLLEALQGQPLISQAELLTKKAEAKRRFFQEVAADYSDAYSQTWLQAILNKPSLTRLVHQLYEKEPATLLPQLLQVLEALRVLSRRSKGELQRLPLFARRITKDPHGFDPGTERGRLFLNALKLIANSSPETAEELTELYYSFGILRDDLWNFVTCTGIQAISEEGGAGYYLFAAGQEGAALNLPLREVVKLGPVYPHTTGAQGQGGKVFIVENSGVFSALLDDVEEQRRERNHRARPLPERVNPPLLCTHGQFKLAGLLLMEKLASRGATLYYSGDFDPEGLAMADRLIRRFPGRVLPWRYDLADYRAALSHERVSPSRLKILEGILSPELIPLKEEMLRTGFVGFQEGIIDRLREDILRD